MQKSLALLLTFGIAALVAACGSTTDAPPAEDDTQVDRQETDPAGTPDDPTNPALREAPGNAPAATGDGDPPPPTSENRGDEEDPLTVPPTNLNLDVGGDDLPER